MPAAAVTDLPVSIDIAPDGTSVRLALRPDRQIKALDAPVIAAHLVKLGIVLSPRGEAEIQELCRPRKAGHIPPPALVAKGVAVIDDVPAHLVLIPIIAATLFASPQVKTGEPVATLVARRTGRDGVDVFGKPIPRQQAAARPMFDASLSPSPDGRTYHAAIDGVVRVRGGEGGKQIAVVACLRREGDVAGGGLQSPGEISVKGNIHSATLRAGGAIHISGDMEDSTAVCEDHLIAGALRNATIDVAGDCVASEVFKSRISCAGELNVDNGSVIGGHVIAAGGLRCKSLGAPPLLHPGIKTVIEIGTNHRIRERIKAHVPELEAKLAKAREIRNSVEPLLQDAQSLTPKQQLRVAELLAKADGLEEQAKSQGRELRAEFDAMVCRSRNEIAIGQVVHPGVTIRFPNAQTTIRIAIKGPCRIILEEKDGQARIMLLQNGHSPMPLELTKSREDWRAAAKKLAA